MAVGMGASLGDRRATLERTVGHLGVMPDTRIERVSRWYRSPPMHGGTATGWFLNGVVLLSTRATPHELLARCVALETATGRRRARFWADRPLDLDVLYVDGWTSDDPHLTVPHPGAASRPFVWWPLREVWPEAAAALCDTPPSPHAIVPVGVFARAGRPTYQALPRAVEAPREAVHRLRKP